MFARENDPMTVEQFLALDREKLDQKYEFRHGIMVAMAGGTINHGLIMSNIHGTIFAHLRRKPCRVVSEMSLRIEDNVYIPDLMVTCDEADITENKTYIEHPKLVIEVLSPSTERDDRREKLWAYTQCDTIQEYVLVNWDVMLVEKRTRAVVTGTDIVQWVEQFYGQGERVELQTIGLHLPVDDIYEAITLPPSESFKVFRKKKI